MGTGFSNVRVGAEVGSIAVIFGFDGDRGTIWGFDVSTNWSTTLFDVVTEWITSLDGEGVILSDGCFFNSRT